MGAVTPRPDGSVTLSRNSPLLVWAGRSKEQDKKKTTILSIKTRTRSVKTNAAKRAAVVKRIPSLEYSVRCGFVHTFSGVQKAPCPSKTANKKRQDWDVYIGYAFRRRTRCVSSDATNGGGASEALPRRTRASGGPDTSNRPIRVSDKLFYPRNIQHFRKPRSPNRGDFSALRQWCTPF